MKPNVSPKQASTKIDPFPSVLRSVQEQLQPYTETPYLDALQLLSHISGQSREKILAHPDLELDPQQETDLGNAVQELQQGTPLPYVLGEWEFYQRVYRITPDVLIPRPETEGLVELAQTWLKAHPGMRNCLELGTGSGCIAITLAAIFPDLSITATDISPTALAVARENASRYQVQDQIRFLERDLLQGVPGQFDLLVGNLPYIPTQKLKTLPVFQTEPRLALDGGQDGLKHIEQVLDQARGTLHPGGAMILEIDEDTGATALDLAHDLWPGITIKLEQDLAGQDRYLILAPS